MSATIRASTRQNTEHNGIHPHVPPIHVKIRPKFQNLTGANGPGVLVPGPHVERQKEFAHHLLLVGRRAYSVSYLIWTA